MGDHNIWGWCKCNPPHNGTNFLPSQPYGVGENVSDTFVSAQGESVSNGKYQYCFGSEMKDDRLVLAYQ